MLGLQIIGQKAETVRSCYGYMDNNGNVRIKYVLRTLFIVVTHICFNMKVITLNVPEEWLQLINDLVREGTYPNRSDCIRHAIRDLLILEKVWQPPHLKKKRGTWKKPPEINIDE